MLLIGNNSSSWQWDYSVLYLDPSCSWKILMNYAKICLCRGKKVNCPSEYMTLEMMTWTELHRSTLNDPSLQGITVSHWSSNSVPGIARFRSALSAACCTETSPLSTCFSKRSRSWCMTPTCTIRIQLPSKERGETKQVDRWDEKLNHVNEEFMETLPCLSQCFDEIEAVAFAFLLFLQSSIL